MRLVLFGMTSIFPASWGTQKLWITSADWSVRKVGVGLAGVAHRHVELVGGDDPELRVADLPPPLVPDDGDLERVRRRRAPLDRVDVAGGHQEQHDDDQERHHRPRELDLGAPVHLGRLAALVARGGAGSG